MGKTRSSLDQIKLQQENKAMPTMLLFGLLVILLIISATPLLGSLKVEWSLNLMLGLFAAFFVMGLVVFVCYPMFG
jgi:hypothetical protein